MTLELDERQLRLTLENVPVPMLAHDETGRIRYLNGEWLRVTGYRPEQIPTFAAWLELALETPEDIAKVMAAHRAGYGAEPGPLHRDWEFSIRAADGSKRRWKIRAFSIGRDTDGRAVNVTMAVDTTRESATLEALAQSESRLRQALRVGEAGHFVRDFAAGVTEYSDELMAIYGLPESRRRESFEQWRERIHPADLGRVVAYSESLPDADAPTAIEYRVTRLSDGATRRIAERREHRRDADGRPVGCIGLQRDVTEPRAAEQALRDSEARLRFTLEAGRVGAFDWDLPSGELIWDERVREIWACPPICR